MLSILIGRLEVNVDKRNAKFENQKKWKLSSH